MSGSEYDLATRKPSEIGIVTTAATSLYIPIIDANGIPQKITLANLITVIGATVGAEISFLDLADTPAAYIDGDTLKTSAVAVVSTTV